MLLMLGVTNPAQAGRKLSDEEMDQVTAGKVEIEITDDVLRFQFQNKGGGKRTVDGSGTLTIKKDQLAVTLGSLMVKDNAQQNLKSLININAVNSQIQILLNLNVNINSQVGTVQQLNISGRF